MTESGGPVPLRVLLLEDSPLDAELLVGELRRAGYEPDAVRVDTEADYVRQVGEGFDVVLADFSLPQFDALQALIYLRERRLNVPVVVVSAVMSDENAIECMRLGAADYVHKDRLARLGPAVCHAIERRQERERRIQMERALQESEARYRAASELTSDFAYGLRVEPDGRMRYEWATDAFTRITGFTIEEVEERGGWLTLVHPEDRARVLEHQRAILDSMATDESEYRMLTKAGEVRYVRDHGRQVWDDQGVQIYGAIKDVTQWKEAGLALRESQERLRESEARYRRIVETAHEAIVLTDAEGVITFANPKAVEMFGYSEPELVGSSFAILLDDATRADLQVRHQRLRQGAYEQFDLKLRRADGSAIWAIVAASPLFDRDGEYVGGLAMCTDITERKLVESELQQAQKLESVGRLAAGIAHEINTPIQFVGDNTHFLQDSFASLAELIGRYRAVLEAAERGPVDPAFIAQVRQAEQEADLEYLTEEIPRAIEQTLDGVERVARIVRAMKDFAHSDLREKAAADLNQGLLSTLIVATNELKYVADVETDLGDLPPVVCRLDDLNQVFLNLLVNAAHAIADVREKTGQRGTIRVSTRVAGNDVVVAISDTGTGIPPEIRSKVFDQFFTTKEVGRGTGQGLALARSVVVDKHGGSLWFETEVGKGTTFYVRIPVDGGADGVGEAA